MSSITDLPEKTAPPLAELLPTIDPATLTQDDKAALMSLVQRAMDHASAERANPARAGEALTQALVLSVTAPSDHPSREALALTDQIAAGLTEIDVARAKDRAETILANN